MAHLKVLDGDGNAAYKNTTGAGTDVSPFIDNVIATAAASGFADGHSITLGATTDAAVSTDAAGTLSAKVRGLVKHMVDLLARMPASLGAQGGLKVEGVASGTAIPVSGTFWQTTQPVSTAGSVAADSNFSLSTGITRFSITTSGSATDATSGSALANDTVRLTAYSPLADFILGISTTGSAAGIYLPAAQLWTMRVPPSSTVHVQTPTTTGTVYISELKS